MTTVSNNKTSFEANTNPDIAVRTKNLTDLSYSGNIAQVIEILNQISSIEVSNFPSGYSTETTLASILAKIITSPATEAKQDTLNTKIDALIAQLTPAASGYVEANVTLGTTANTVLALNANRKGGFIQNLSDTDVFISEFIAPTTTTGFVLAPYGTYTIRSTNLIRGITSTSNKIVRVASW